MMELERLQDLSVYYWLKGQLPDFVQIVDAFPAQINQADTPLTLPVVSVDHINIRAVAFELGGLETNEQMWAIDVFAKQKSQRDDFTYKLVNELKHGIPVYDYNQGFPPVVIDCIGALITDNIQAKPVYVFRDLVKDLYWRSTITFSSRYQPYN